MPDPTKSAIEYLETIVGYECKDVLGKGTYGSVYKIVGEDQSIKAAKIVQVKVANMLEVREWPRLNHENILCLLETMLNVEGVIIFITEIMDTNLFLFLQDKTFRKDPFAPEKCRLFARQIFSGLAYLHDRNLCHMDLRAENVFVASRDRVVVADFSGLTYATDARSFCPLPRALRPPEMLTGKKMKVAPKPVDLWCCGMLLTFMLIGRGFYGITVQNPKAGSIEAVRQYTDCFASKSYVASFLSATYCNSKISENKISELITFIGLFLQMLPDLRINAVEALEHNFMCSCVTEVLPSATEAQDSVSKQETDKIPTPKKVRIDIKAKDMDTRESDDCLKAKRSKWMRYRPSIENIRKLYLSSPPLFRKRKSNRKKEETQSLSAPLHFLAE